LLLGDKLGALRVYLILTGASNLFLTLAWGVNLVYQVERVGLNPFQLVLVGTALELTCFLFEIPTGVVADVYSRRTSVIIGTIVLGVGFIIMGAVPNFWVILLSQVICGIGYTFTSGAQQAWIADEVGEERAASAFVRGAQVAQIGGVVGVLAAIGFGLISLGLPTMVGGALLIVLGGFLLLFMPEHGFAPAPREDRSTWQSMGATFVDGTRLVRQRPILLTILGIAFFFGMYNEGFDRLWTAHLLDNFALPTLISLDPVVWVGGISVVINLLGIVGLELTRRKLNMHSHSAVTRALIAINAGLVSCVIGFALAGSFMVAASAYIAASVLRESIYPIKQAWLNQNLDSRVRATVLSIDSQSDAIGQIAGGPAVGAIGTIFSLRAALTTAGLILVPGLLLYARALGQGGAVEGAVVVTGDG
jgi:MFS transporter, DHA3 family, tetracycline resistance protein